MKDKRKRDFLQIRITAEEKREMQKSAKKNGFDTVTAFILWLFRKHGRK